MHDWIEFAKQLRSIAQTGQTYTQNKYELERYRQLEALTNTMFAVLADVPIEKVEAVNVPDRGYATPKVDVRGAVFQDGRILLVKEKSDGLWTLPGGWADVCENPSLGVIREIAEESGFIAANPRLVMLKDRNLHPYHPDHIYKLFYLCDHVGGSFVDNIETDAAEFFALDRLPPLSLGRTLPEDIQHLWAFACGGITEVYSD